MYTPMPTDISVTDLQIHFSDLELVSGFSFRSGSALTGGGKIKQGRNWGGE